MFIARQTAPHVMRTSLRAHYASLAATKHKYKVVVVGAGSAGITIANQIYNRFHAAGKALNDGDIAILDAAEYHNYQPGWTLVGAGLRTKQEFRKPNRSLIDSHLTYIPENVKAFTPSESTVTTTTGNVIGYESLVVATGLQINWNGIPGLSEGLADPTSGVSSIYSYDSCDKVWGDIESLKSGRAIFTQPAGIVKCAGAPQKIMWMAWDRYTQTHRRNNIKIDFFTGMPTIFSVKKYSDALEKLRIERGVGGFYQHNLTSIDVKNRKATFKKLDGSTVEEDYDRLHAVPPMGPLEVMKGSPLADSVGWADINKDTLQHNKYSNIWALGDCSSLPTSKTAAAITAQAPVLTENLFSVVDTGKLSTAVYDGYTSCPLLTGYGQLLLAEFKYGLEPKESFGAFIDQAKPNRAFYHLKKDLFPWAYYNAMLHGRWFGASGPLRPTFAVPS